MTINCPLPGTRGFRTTHGLRRSPEYAVWNTMKSRCLNPKCKKYPNYGGRGIRVCEKWMKFDNFYKDMGARPTRKHTIERIDTNGDYEPSNCKWSTNSENCRNKRNNVLVTHEGRTQCVKAWSEELGIPYARLQARIKRGWNHERAITE